MEYRTLHEEELPRWFLHCEFVFKVPASYFQAHYFNDPDRTLAGIFVAVDTANNNEIAATVRVFHRRLYIRGSVFSMGGIGEVSTKPHYQHKGIGTTLLKMAKEYMNAQKMEVSTLSTSPGTMPYYGRLGWVSVPLQFTLIKNITAEQKGINFPKDWTFEFAESSSLSAADVEGVKTLYDGFIRFFSGGVVRSNEYFDKYVLGREMAKLFVIREKGAIIGYFTLEKKDDGTHLKEFSCPSAYYKDGRFVSLLEFGLPRAVEHLQLPSLDIRILSPIGKSVLMDNPREERPKISFMFQEMDGSQGRRRELLRAFMDNPIDHVFWETDGF